VYSDLLLAAVMEMQAQHAPADYRCRELIVFCQKRAFNANSSVELLLFSKGQGMIMRSQKHLAQSLRQPIPF
jgi:hypothetical protein